MAFIITGFADEIDENLSVQLDVLNQLGIEYLEMRGVDGKNVSSYTPEEMKNVKKRLDDSGIKVSSVGSPIGKISITDDFDEHLASFKNTLELAKILETDYIRLFSFYLPEGENIANYRDEVLSRINVFVKTAKGSGITLLHENEKGIYGATAAGCLDIFESIGSDTLRAVFDPANFILEQEITYPKAYEMLKPYIEYFHIKDAKYTGEIVPSGMGDGKISEILTDAAQSGFNGFLSLEPHLGSFKGLELLEKTDLSKKLPQGGAQTFTIAYNALREVINKI